MGRHRGRRRCRRDRAVPLLRVKAALPLRDHGRGHRGLPQPVRRDHRRASEIRARARGRDGELLRALRARGAAQPRAGRRAGPAVQPQHLRARGAGPPSRAGAHARPGVRLGELPRRRDARRRDPGDRPAPAHPRRARPLQQHLALVSPERHHRAARVAEYYTELALAMVGVPPAAPEPQRVAA